MITLTEATRTYQKHSNNFQLSFRFRFFFFWEPFKCSRLPSSNRRGKFNCETLLCCCCCSSDYYYYDNIFALSSGTSKWRKYLLSIQSNQCKLLWKTCFMISRWFLILWRLLLGSIKTFDKLKNLYCGMRSETVNSALFNFAAGIKWKFVGRFKFDFLWH